MYDCPQYPEFPSAGLTVKELTGDMQLTKKEMAETQMIVTTPEKWDVITRKGGDVAVAASVRLLIIDEVHLLNDERGPVIETIIARTQRQVCCPRLPCQGSSLTVLVVRSLNHDPDNDKDLYIQQILPFNSLINQL